MAIRLNLLTRAPYAVGMIRRLYTRYVYLIGLCFVVYVPHSWAANKLPPVMDLQRSYIAENGGLANIQELSSLVASGDILDAEGNAHPFKLYRKRPDLMRIQIDLPQGAQMTIFDGRQAFRVVSRMGVPDKTIDLDTQEHLELKATSTMDGPFFALRSRPEQLEVVAEVEVDGQPAYEIAIGEGARSIYDRIWISQEHFQEVKILRPLQSNEGGAEFEEIYFSDFEKIRGMWVAKLIRYERNGKHVQTVRIDRVRANVGVFDSFFARPKN